MDRRFLMHYRSLVLSSLLLSAVQADIPCQEGVTYKSSCNPYKVEFIRINRVKDDGSTLDEKKQEKKKRQWFSRSYLNTLLEKYSSNYDGRAGLQALIDRSHYGKEQKKKQELDKREQIKELANQKQTQKKQKSQHQEVVQVQPDLSQKIKKESLVAIKEPQALRKEVKEKKRVKSVNKELTSKSTTTKEKPTQKRVKLVKKEKSTPQITSSSSKKSQKRKVVAKKLQVELAAYRVKKGDTLTSIASALGLSVKELKSLNRIGKDGKIKIGEKLLVPKKLLQKFKKQEELKIAKQKKKRELLAKKRLQEQLKKGIYIVQKGDTLSSIASKTKLSINQLREYNRIARSSHIKVGQKLLLKEPKVTKRRGSSLNYVKNIKFKSAPSLKFKRKIRVIATAYTSHRNQTDKTPFLAAWNNRIKPGMKIIAVSEDLIKKYGLKNGVKVKITGLPGYYVVRDKMNKRLRNHIDIYMGLNKRKALRWGRRRVALYW